MGRPRPYKAAVWLPGRGEDGSPILVRVLSYASEEGLAAACRKWRDDGYAITAWEDLALDLGI